MKIKKIKMNLTKIIDKEYEKTEQAIAPSGKPSSFVEYISDSFNECLDYFPPSAKERSYDNTLYLYESFFRDSIIQRTEIGFSMLDITLFSNEVIQYKNHGEFKRIGLFLSLLISLHYEKNYPKEKYVIENNEYEKETDFFGHKLCGPQVIVTGGCGNYLGNYMKSGQIQVAGSVGFAAGNQCNGELLIDGDAENNLGHGLGPTGKLILFGSAKDHVGLNMQGGTLIIKKNAGDLVGMFMLDGTIHIEGDCGKKIGEEMYGGEIHLFGNYKSLGKPAQARRVKLFHKRIALDPYH